MVNVEKEENNDSTIINFTLEEGIDSIGFGLGQIIILIVTGLVFGADAMEIMLISYILPDVTDTFNLNGWQSSFFASAVFLGMLLGALPTGILSDKYGRKKIIWIWLIIGFSFALLSSIAYSYWFILLTRTVVGFSIGGASHLSFSLFAECIPSSKRGFWMMIFVTLWAAGSVAEALLAWAVLPRFGWRRLVIVSAFPLGISMIGFFFISESPKYYLASNKFEKAHLSLEQIAKRNGKELPNGNLIDIENDKERGNLKDLFPNITYSILTILVISIWILCSFIYYGIVLITPDYLIDNPNQLYLGSLLSALSEFPGYILAGILVEKIGRTHTMTISFFLCGIAFLLSMFPLGFYLGILSTMIGRGSIAAAYNAIWIYTPEVYPTRIRSTAMGLGSSAARISGIITPFVATGAMTIYYQLPFIIYVIANIIGFIATILLPFETKAKPLPEEYLNKNNITIKEQEKTQVELSEIDSSETNIEQRNV